MKKSVSSIAFLFVFLLFTLFNVNAETTDDAAQPDQQPSVSFRYDTGDKLFFFDAGPLMPLFVLIPGGSPVYNPITDNMYLGGNASMGFEAFLNHTTSIGLELGYTFSYAKDLDLYTAVPLAGNVSYYILQGSLDVPITLGAGFIYNKYHEKSYFSPIFLKPEIGIIWNFTDNWGLGIDTSYWFVPEFYTGDSADNTAYFNAVSAKLTLQYRQ